MSKLLKFKSWLTLEEAARHLTGAIEGGGEVGVADLLQLALDGHLRLSANMAGLAKGRPGTAMTGEQIPYRKATYLLPSGEVQEVTVPAGRLIGEDEVLVFGDGVFTVSGVWDLTMMGGEHIALQNMLNESRGVPPISLEAQAATIFRSGPTSPQYFELHAPKDPPEPDGPAYVPASGLPKDAHLVVRVAELQRFLSTFAQASEAAMPPAAKSGAKPNDGSLATRERNNLLCIIGALCKAAKVDHTKASKAAAVLAGFATEMGMNLAESTIEEHLKKVAEAVGARTK